MSIRSIVLVPVLALLVLTGCRTYGGRDTEAKTYQQMQQAVRQFSDDLGRAEADLQSLESAAESNAALQPFAERFASVVERHEDTLAEHQSKVDALTASSGYRDLHRAYGAIITDQRLIGKLYNRVVDNVHATVRGIPLAQTDSLGPSYYQVEPLEYDRIRNAERLTMDQALRSNG